jgi:hypothetical protein
MTEDDHAAQVPAQQPEAALAAARVRRAIGALRDALDELESALAAGEGVPEDGQEAAPVETPTAGYEPGQTAPSLAWAAWSRPVDAPPPGAWASPSLPQPSPAPGAGPDAGGEEDPREQVRRAVESIRAELDAGASPAEPGHDAAWGAPAAEPDPSGPSRPEGAAPEEMDPREQVRRAVEQLRMELGLEVRDDGPRPSWSSVPEEAATRPGLSSLEAPRPPSYESLIDERLLQPALIVIDDPEGRVELVRVYRTLSRLGCAATANLANYSSHSVTVQLEERRVPDASEIHDAVAYAFERECEVEVDGNRVSIRLAGGKTRAA